MSMQNDTNLSVHKLIIVIINQPLIRNFPVFLYNALQDTILKFKVFLRYGLMITPSFITSELHIKKVIMVAWRKGSNYEKNLNVNHLSGI